MIYLLDTNAISALMRADMQMASWLSSVGVDDRVVICTIGRGEILFGLERLAEGRRRTEFEGKARMLFAVLPCEPIPAAAGDLYAHVKMAQQRRGLPLDENDLWMAATALAINATLVSRDSEFQAIEGLAVDPMATTETALLDYEMARQEPELGKKLTHFDSGIHLAVASGSSPTNLARLRSSRVMNPG